MAACHGHARFRLRRLDEFVQPFVNELLVNVEGCDISFRPEELVVFPAIFYLPKSSPVVTLQLKPSALGEGSACVSNRTG